MNILRKIREIDRALNDGIISYEEATNLVQPFTDAEPVKHGHWIDDWVCSECIWEHTDDSGNPLITTYEYCPHCGAKMDSK